VKKSVGLVFIFLCLTLCCVGGIQPVSSQTAGIIYIRADGSVDPSTAPIKQVGQVYVFTQNIAGSIIVEKDDITIDGSGYSLQGPGKRTYALNGTGIFIYSKSNMTVKNISINAFVIGIYLYYYSNQSTIFGNNITNCIDHGIYVLRSNNNSIFGNSLSGSGQSGIQVVESSNNSIHENNITANGNGIGMGASDYNTIYQNIIAKNSYAFSFDGASRNIIYESNIIDNGNQVYAWRSSNDWDNGSIGNYWSDYKTRYPNATEIDVSGIGNTPYKINTLPDDYVNADKYPILKENIMPEDSSPTPNPTTSPTSPSASGTPNPTLSPTASVTPSNSQTQQPTLEPAQSAQPTIVPIADGVGPLSYVIGIVAVVIVAVAVSFVIYFKKLGKNQQKNYTSKNYKTTLITHYTHNIMWVERDHGKAY
jgi:parallel beta-helix repeat protein